MIEEDTSTQVGLKLHLLVLEHFDQASYSHSVSKAVLANCIVSYAYKAVRLQTLPAACPNLAET